MKNEERIRQREGYSLSRMDGSEARETEDWMVRQYGFERAEVREWIETLRFDWPLSVKARDTEGRTIGLLNMSAYRIEEEAEDMPQREPELLRELNSKRYTAVFSFIVAEGWRGTRLNYDMIQNIMPELKERFDFVFIPVMHRLKTHAYWKRWGATEFYRDEACVYYRLPLDTKQGIII